MKQGGKTYTTNSKFQMCIGNKHYTGWKAALIMGLIPFLVVVSFIAFVVIVTLYVTEKIT